MFKELGQIGSLLKQAQNLTGKLQETQARMAAARFEGTDSDGLVRVTVSGQGLLTDCSISEQLLASGDGPRIERAVIDAANASLTAMKQSLAQEMSGLTGGMDLSNLGGLLGSMGGR